MTRPADVDQTCTLGGTDALHPKVAHLEVPRSTRSTRPTRPTKAAGPTPIHPSRPDQPAVDAVGGGAGDPSAEGSPAGRHPGAGHLGQRHLGLVDLRPRGSEQRRSGPHGPVVEELGRADAGRDPDDADPPTVPVPIPPARPAGLAAPAAGQWPTRRRGLTFGEIVLVFLTCVVLLCLGVAFAAAQARQDDHVPISQTYER